MIRNFPATDTLVTHDSPPAATGDRLSFFLEAVGEALKTLDEEECQEILFRRILEAARAERGCLLLFDLYDQLKIVRRRGLFADGTSAPPEPFGDRIHEVLVRSKGPAIVEGEDPLGPLRSGSPWPGWALWVPVQGRDRGLGGGYLEGFAGDRPSPADLRFLEALATHLGASLDTARIYQEHEKKKQRIEKLNKVLERQIETQTLRIKRMASELQNSRKEIQLKYNYDRIVGKSAKMQEVFAILDKVTDSDLPVMIQGESGTGKELIAKAVHYNGKRKEMPFVSENCAAIGENLFESELFGYEKGAFTGADETKPGLFEVADGGTLFLDEIGDLNLENQKKILRALQEGEIRRVGGKTPIPVDVRIISATNRNLEQLIKEGAFREDLYYRLKVVTIKLPPLREHVEDIPPLVDHFLKEIGKDRAEVPQSLAPETMRAFLSYSWPGNVRELENEVHRLVIMGERDFRPGATTSVRRYQGTGFAIPPGLGMEEALALFERDLLLGALEEAGWNKSAAAKALKIGRMKLHRKMERLGLDREEAK